MDDREVVAAIVAGDPTGLAEAYDRYAAALYTYCRSLIRDPADATATVQDTFVIATAKLAELRDPGRLRPWLYAVARNECRRGLGTKAATSGLNEALLTDPEPAKPGPTYPDAVNDPADASGDAERAELREALRVAITELNPSQQEVIELRLQHQLEGPDLADVLGVPRKQAQALLSGAHAQLERSLGDRRRELHPAMLLGLLPLAVLPVGFWPELLTICADDTPEAIAHRTSVVNRAGWFGSTGFPMPVDPPKPTGWRQSGRLRTVSAVAAAAVIGTIAALTLSGASRSLGLASGPATSPAAGTSASSSPDGPSGSPAPSPRSGIPATAVPGAIAPGSPSAGKSGSATAPGSRSSSTSSSPASPSSSSTVSQGTLNVTPKVLVLTSASGAATGTLTLTAQNGPVTQYLITSPVLLIGSLTISPSAGSLASGQSVQVTVTLQGHVTFDRRITVDPGGQFVRVLLGVGLGS